MEFMVFLVSCFLFVGTKIWYTTILDSYSYDFQFINGMSDCLVHILCVQIQLSDSGPRYSLGKGFL